MDGKTNGGTNRQWLWTVAWLVILVVLAELVSLIWIRFTAWRGVIAVGHFVGAVLTYVLAIAHLRRGDKLRADKYQGVAAILFSFGILWTALVALTWIKP